MKLDAYAKAIIAALFTGGAEPAAEPVAAAAASQGSGRRSLFRLRRK